MRTRAAYFMAALLAISPDFDFFGYIAKVPYASFWGHRGFTHSILFALICGLIAAIFFERKSFKNFTLWTILFFLVTISHALLDACTNGGLGVAFYSPYSLTHRSFTHGGSETLRQSLLFLVVALVSTTIPRIGLQAL